MKQFFYRYVAVGVAILSLAACSDTISDVQFEDWEPEIAAPVLDTRFTLRDALADSDFTQFLTEDANSAINVRISQELFDVAPGDLLEVPEFTIPLFDTVNTINLEDEGVDIVISRMDIVDGQLKYTFRNDFPQDAEVTILTSNWIVAERSFQHTYTVPALTTTSDSVQLPRLSFIVPSSGNVDVQYSAKLSTGTNVRLTAGAVEFQGADYSYAEGQLDKLNVDLGEELIATDYFDAFEPGTVALVDPVARIIVENEVGIPFQLMTSSAFATTREGTIENLTSQLSDGVLFSFPSRAEGKVPKTSEVIIDSETSNILEVLNEFPESLELGLEATANPDALEETYFIHRDARLKGQFNMDIPLALEFNGFKLEEEFIFDGSSIAEAQTAAFLLRVDNGFGLEAATQVYFYDAQGALLDSLFATPETIIAAPEIDASGVATSSIEKTTEVVLDQSQIATIANSRSAKVKLTLHSPDTGAQFTSLFYDNSIGIKLGARVTVKPL